MLQIEQAVQFLRKGGLVAFPTETVYGLGADAKNPEALKKIFQAKGRPIDHPLIVHIADISQLSEWAREISEDALKLAASFWPGPLTLIFKKNPHVLDLVTGNQDTVGLRIPSHPIAMELLKKFGSGIAAPSANRFGRLSPTSVEAVKEELGKNVDLILDGGICAVGVESTIVDLSGKEIVILRPGLITAKEIASVLGKSIRSKKKNLPRVSGAFASHYAPCTPVSLVSAEHLENFLENLKKENITAMVLTRNTHLSSRHFDLIRMPETAAHYAHDLYQTLRQLDKKKLQRIVIEELPGTEEWDAVRDRLEKMKQSLSLRQTKS